MVYSLTPTPLRRRGEIQHEMKRLIILILSLAFVSTSQAQTWEEWTRQKKTKIKRLLEQIAANKVYIEYAQKGYKIVTDGLHTIRDIKDGDFRMHLGFFDSLQVVNPKIRNSAKVAAIIASQIRLIKVTKQALDAVRESRQFTNDELDYCKRVFDQLLDECVQHLDELLVVITNGKASMSDDERLQRIDRLYADLQEKSSFTASFSNEMSVLAIQRMTEQTELDYSKRIKGF